MEPKILVGIPVPLNGTIDPRFKESLKRLRGDGDILYMPDLPQDAYKGDKVWRIARSRERIRQYFLTRDYTHLFFLDSDVIAPPETIELLLKVDEDVVSHGYRSNIEEFLKDKKYWSGVLPSIEVRGLGCTLVKRKVLEKCGFMEGIKEEMNQYGEDILWRERVKKEGFKIYNISTKLELVHLPWNRELFWDQLRKNPRAWDQALGRMSWS